MRRAVIISFCTRTERFDSLYERNKFFRGLYGWRQTIKRGKDYTYQRQGLLDEIPHIKVDNSVFIVALKEIEKMLSYMRRWDNKVEYKTFEVGLNEDQARRLEWKKIKVE